MSKQINISQGRLALYAIGLIALTAVVTIIIVSKSTSEDQFNAEGNAMHKLMNRIRGVHKKEADNNNISMLDELANPEKKDLDVHPVTKS
jgi:hypothetical protein